MMTDLRHIRVFSAFLSKTEIKFDLVSAVDELAAQVCLLCNLLSARNSHTYSQPDFITTCSKLQMAQPVMRVPPIWDV